MKIEIWSDFTCPFCYIGKKHLELAIEQFGNKDVIEIEFMSFELDPNADHSAGIKKIEMLMDRYGMTEDKVMEMTEGIYEQGTELGLDLNFDNMIHTNTFQAHRLVKYSYKKNKSQQLIDLLFSSYFGDNENIGNRNVLMKMGEKIGLDTTDIDAFLCLNKYSKAVRADQQLAAELGIQGVPFFVFNETYAVSGAQSVDVFHNVLTELWIEEAEEKKAADDAGTCKKSYCTGNDCEIE